MNPIAWVGGLLLLALVGWIVGEGIVAAVKNKRDRELREARDAGWSEGFASGADVDDKTRRIGERARRLSR